MSRATPFIIPLSIAALTAGMLALMVHTFEHENDWTDVHTLCDARGGLVLHNPIRCVPYPEKLDGGCAK